MTTKHTPEPWYLEPSEETTNAYEVKCKGGYYVATANDAVRGHDDPKENARRIVACVNACEGISTEQLESWLCMSRPILQSIKELKAEADREAKQCDCLLYALREMLVLAESVNWDETFLERARAAIASVEGKSK